MLLIKENSSYHKQLVLINLYVMFIYLLLFFVSILTVINMKQKQSFFHKCLLN